MKKQEYTSAAGNNSGFTLLEMIVVLVIIGLIAGLVGPNMFKAADNAKVQTAETQIKNLRGMLHTLRLDIGRFPSEEEGLELLVRSPSDDTVSRYWSGPYLDSREVPLDPWNNAYVYTDTGSEFEGFTLYSLGADGEPGGEGNDRDIGYLPTQ